MPSEKVELRGHIVDSLLLPKVLDEIIARDGRFEIESLEIGRRREDQSRAVIRVEAADAELLDEILTRVQEHGAEPVLVEDVHLEPAPADGVYPEHFHVTSNFPTEVRVGGVWLPVLPQRMDCGIVVAPGAVVARAVRFPEVRRGDLVVVGHRGVRVHPLQRDVRRADHFEFMASDVSAEKPKGLAIRAVAESMRAARARGERVLLVAGPAVVHTGAAPHVVRLIEAGFIQVLFAGNALAVHDIEHAFYGTALGVHLEHGLPVERGHQHHLHAINRIRAAGGIAAAVAQGLLTSGIMHACIRHGVEFVLAGSIRDDGPLPEVITDVMAAQRAMADQVPGVGFALVVATMLHGIAAGNMLPASCRIACVDIHPGVVTKLTDRGSFQTVGIVTDVEPFFHELLATLG
jgi:lysine-ketoglutarate reductase/saccharopine dehydrogenase-like protein (TIGR00300 family)